MIIYDISQEILSCTVYPDDPVPSAQRLCSMDQGSLYNLTAFSMCAHNGTHIDAPCHFIQGGKSIDRLDLSAVVGRCCVLPHEGDMSERDAKMLLSRAHALSPEGSKRLLIKGQSTVTEQAARIFSAAGLLLIGVESQSVGPIESPMAVHRILLDRQTVLLEGIRLSQVPAGVYLLSAAPVNIAGADGAPCRAILIDEKSADLLWKKSETVL